MAVAKGCGGRRAAVSCLTVIVGFGLCGCGSSIDDAVKAPVTVTAPGSTVTVSATGTGSAATVSVTETVTERGSAGAGETVTETVTENAGPNDTSTQTSQSSPTGLKVGAAITDTSDQGTATITVVSAQRKTAGTGAYSKAPKNGNYLLIDVSYLCTTGKCQYNPFDWKVRDKDGRTFDSGSSFSSGYDDAELQSGTLAKGAKARGTVVFDVPKGALTLEYGDGYNQAPASWNIPA